MSDLAVAICTKDNMRTIGRTLDSLVGVADRIVVVDSGSTDGTVELCREKGAEVVHRDWQGMVQQRQYALDLCKHNRWVLLLDSDESLESELRAAITRTVAEDDSAYQGWMLNRKVWFQGRWLHHAFQPEWRLRLVRPEHARVTGSEPHDQVEISGRVGRLKGTLRHDSWADLEDWATRNLTYAARAAAGARTGGRATDLLLRPAFAFTKQFLFKCAFLDGWRGIVASCMVAQQTLLKHVFIAGRRGDNGRL